MWYDVCNDYTLDEITDGDVDTTGMRVLSVGEYFILYGFNEDEGAIYAKGDPGMSGYSVENFC